MDHQSWRQSSRGSNQGSRLEQDIMNLEAAISQMESEQGIFAPGLIELLLRLGSSLRQQGDHEDTLALLGRAEQIARVNFGLTTVEQLAVVEAMIESHIALGDHEAAADKQAYLMMLMRENFEPDDPERLPMLVRQGDWYMDRFARNINASVWPGTITPALVEGRNRDDTPREIRRRAFGSLFQAQGNYRAAVAQLRASGGSNVAALAELEKKLLTGYFFQANRLGIIEEGEDFLDYRLKKLGSRIRLLPDPDPASYNQGAASYRRLLSDIGQSPGARVADYVDLLLEAGDWELMFRRRERAMEHYRHAHDMLSAAGLSDSQVDHYLNPPVPVMLPAFMPAPHSRQGFGIAPEQELSWLGYTEVAFTLGGDGRARRVRILGSSEGAGRDIQQRLVSILRNARFRPLYPHGDRGDEREMALRYYHTW